MKARIKGFDDPFTEIETLTMKGVNGTFYVDDVEFEQQQETTADHWQNLRERAAIAVLPQCVKAVQDALMLGATIEEGVIEQATASAIDIADALVAKLKGE